jgi:hypothetical protein
VHNRRFGFATTTMTSWPDRIRVDGINVYVERAKGNRAKEHRRPSPPTPPQALYVPGPGPAAIVSPGQRTFSEAARAQQQPRQQQQQQHQQQQQQRQPQQQQPHQTQPQDHWAQQVARFASAVQFGEQPPTNPSLDDIVMSAVRTALAVLLNPSSSPSNASALPVFRQGGPTAAHQ